MASFSFVVSGYNVLYNDTLHEVQIATPFVPSATSLIFSDGEADNTWEPGDVLSFDEAAEELIYTYIGYTQFGPVISISDSSSNVFNNAMLTDDSTLALNDVFPLIAGDFPVCFLGGTMIATLRGERAVETLAAGDLVLTADGAMSPVLWIGRQTVVSRFGDPLRSYPIRIAAGALGEAVPIRDLHVSPDHAMLVDGMLIQAGVLVNGTSITRVEQPEDRFTYYHIELKDHALVLAEGAAAESFVDNVTRRRFDNYAEYEALFGESRARIPELELPRVKSARQLPRALREQLAARAERLGFADAAAA